MSTEARAPGEDVEGLVLRLDVARQALLAADLPSDVVDAARADIIEAAATLRDLSRKLERRDDDLRAAEKALKEGIRRQEAAQAEVRHLSRKLEEANGRVEWLERVRTWWQGEGQSKDWFVDEEWDSGEWGVHGPMRDGHDHVYPSIRFPATDYGKESAEAVVKLLNRAADAQAALEEARRERDEAVRAFTAAVHAAGGTLSIPDKSIVVVERDARLERRDDVVGGRTVFALSPQPQEPVWPEPGAPAPAVKPPLGPVRRSEDQPQEPATEAPEHWDDWSNVVVPERRESLKVDAPATEGEGGT